MRGLIARSCLTTIPWLLLCLRGASGEQLMAALLAKHEKCAVPATQAARLGCLFGELYPEDAGFEPDVSESSPGQAYGEVSPEVLMKVLEQLPGGSLDQDDVFVDLGSGVGKVPLQVFLTSPVKKAAGVELAPLRHNHAVEALRGVSQAASKANFQPQGKEAQLTWEGRQLVVENTDGLAAELPDATVVFLSGRGIPFETKQEFRKSFAANLKPGSLVVTLTRLPGCIQGLLMLQRKPLRASWGDAHAHVYVVTPQGEDMFGDLGSGNDGKFSEGKFGSSPKQLERLRQAFVMHAKDLEYHKKQGTVASSNHCQALEIMSAIGRSEEKAQALIHQTDLYKTDKFNHDVLRHLISENQVAKEGPKTKSGKLTKAAKEKADKIMDVINMVVRRKVELEQQKGATPKAKGGPQLLTGQAEL